MIRVSRGVHPEDIRQSGKHVLFVEGAQGDSFDPQVISELLGQQIQIEALGPSFNVKSVAKALYSFHPTYYFVIDRDHHHDNDESVDRYWANFPDPETHNLLIWKCREIENYFLEPGYLELSDFLEVKRAVLEDKIREICQKRLFLDVANHVIVSIREDLKSTWIQIFKNSDEFGSREQALAKLHNADEFGAFNSKVVTATGNSEIECRFDKVLYKMTDGAEQLEFGKGKWLEMTQGKLVLKQVVNSSCFKVEDVRENALQGEEKLLQVVKNLLKMDVAKQPADFQELKRLVAKRLSSH